MIDQREVAAMLELPADVHLLVITQAITEEDGKTIKEKNLGYVSDVSKILGLFHSFIVPPAAEHDAELKLFGEIEHFQNCKCPASYRQSHIRYNKRGYYFCFLGWFFIFLPPRIKIS